MSDVDDEGESTRMPPPLNPEISAMLALMQQQMQAAETREHRLSLLVDPRGLQNPRGQPSISSSKPISTKRPVLQAFTTLADVCSWEEAWQDYAICQHLSTQSRETRVSAVRQAFDEEIRRFLREGIICIPTSADVPAIITAVKAYIRRQRNPLLDRIEFYQRHQQRGESFDSFYTSLKELFSACDFSNMVVCPTCSSRMCSTCPQTLLQVNDDLMRDRLVVGLHDDEVRHKLLAETKLTLGTTVKLCRAEEAARQTGQHIAPATASVNATRSTYKRKQFTKPASTTIAQGKPNTKPSVKCNNCGRSAHTKSPCPAAGKKCNGCHGI